MGIMMQQQATPRGWLAFEQNVLARMDFKSAILPFTSDPALGVFLKRRGVRVSANDLMQSAWTRAVAAIQNSSEKLSDDDVNGVLEDVYVPGHKLRNPALRNWFSETDAWWFDNVRGNLDRLGSPFKFALAADVAMAVGDYVLSFTEETRELRQPLTNVYRRLWMEMGEPINNGQNNTCQNKPADDFIAESSAEMMFLRLPVSGIGGGTGYSPTVVWREEWLRGGNDFWAGLNAARNGKLGAPVETKSQYLRLLRETLQRSLHINNWAIAHVENTFVSTQELVETIAHERKVEAVYTKDFSELTGTKAVIITA
jgi:hypothetical protein